MTAIKVSPGHFPLCIWGRTSRVSLGLTCICSFLPLQLGTTASLAADTHLYTPPLLWDRTAISLLHCSGSVFSRGNEKAWRQFLNRENSKIFEQLVLPRTYIIWETIICNIPWCTMQYPPWICVIALCCAAPVTDPHPAVLPCFPLLPALTLGQGDFIHSHSWAKVKQGINSSPPQSNNFWDSSLRSRELGKGGSRLDELWAVEEKTGTQAEPLLCWLRTCHGDAHSVLPLLLGKAELRLQGGPCLH